MLKSIKNLSLIFVLIFCGLMGNAKLAYAAVPAICGPANGQTYNDPSLPSPWTELCVKTSTQAGVGIGSNAPVFSGTGWTWKCRERNSTAAPWSYVNCSSIYQPAVNGSCGAAAGGNSSTPPSSNLCGSGSPSAVTIIDTSAYYANGGTYRSGYSWTCHGSGGGSNATCASNAAQCNGVSFSWTGDFGDTCTGPVAATTLASGGTSTSTDSMHGAAYVYCDNGIAKPTIVSGVTWSYCSYPACGAANGVTTATAPTSGLCSSYAYTTYAGSSGFTATAGVIGPVRSNATSWAWDCGGWGSSASCSAPKPAAVVNGTCGTSNGGTFGNSTPPTTNFCTAGSASTVTTNPSTYTWSCVGSGGGTNASCSATRSAAAVNGVCSGTAGACTAGSATGDNGLTACGTTRLWTCNGSGGGTNASCSLANAACPSPVNGTCGGTANTCGAGTPSGYSAGTCGGSKTWSCVGSSGGSTASCSLANAACGVNGACAATHNNCSAGVSADLADTAIEYKWQCNGTGGGTNSPVCVEAKPVSCSANLGIINGTCGTANGVGTVSAPTTGLCATGTQTAPSNSNPLKWKWNCNGSGGGTNASCVAPAFTCPSVKYQCKVYQNRKTGRNYSYILEYKTTSSFVNTYQIPTAFAVGNSYNPDWRNWTGVQDCSVFEISQSCTTSRTGGMAACTFYDSSKLTSGLDMSYTPTPACAADDGVCGTAHASYATNAPTTGLCSKGLASAVSGTGPWNWTCGTGSGIAHCTAAPKLNGTCGSANGVASATAPSLGLCAAGAASAVSGTGPFTWTCSGSGGGTTANCNAPLPAPAPTFGGACPSN